MHKLSRIVLSFNLLAIAALGTPVTHYVDVNSTNPAAPYLSWASAAVTIQDAVNSANSSDTVLVTNGIYNSGGAANFGSNRVSITKPITLQSVNGGDVTVIEGRADPYTTFGTNSTRCLYVGVPSVSVIGFTLTNGTTLSGQSGGGAFWPVSGFLADSLITGCRADRYGGGISGTSFSPPLTVSNCIISSNSAPFGAASAYGGAFYNCIITNNSASSVGGGVYSDTSPTSLTGCVVSGNHAGSGGGAYFCTATNCVFAYNSASTQGGAIYGGFNMIVYNCLLLSNTAAMGGGLFGGAARDCTIVGNSAGQGGGIYTVGGPLPGISVANSIIYYNSATNAGANWYQFPQGADFCCTTPPISSHDITNEPGFVNLLTGDFHLQSNSPCINSGRNAYIAGSIDFDGNPRIGGDTVDLGAYEYKNPASLLSYGWLQQYGFATDGSADYSDPDGDGINNWQEWIANTDPTDPTSFLHLLSPHRVQTGVTLTWPAITNQSYFIQTATNAKFPAWITLQTNLSTKFAATNVITYTDSPATNTGPYFYRVGTSR